MKQVLIDGLLVVGVVVQLGCAIGIVVMRDAYQRLHYAAAATTIGPICIAAAVVARTSFSAPGEKAVLTAVLLLVGGALVVHATGRAARIREHDGWRILDDEVESMPDSRGQQ